MSTQSLTHTVTRVVALSAVLLFAGTAPSTADDHAPEPSAIASGKFKSGDLLHRGRGKVTVHVAEDGTREVRFTDFKVTRGPDLKVWLVASDGVRRSRDVKSSETRSLGELINRKGDQSYEIPADVDLEQFSSVVVWCERFGVLFAAASLESLESA